MNMNEGINYIAYNGSDAPFSNFFIAPFEAKVINSNTKQQFQSVEQYFQYSKAILAGDTENAKKLLQETNGTHIKHIGRSIKNFNSVSKKWNTIKYNVLYEGIKAKFSQNKELQEQLLSTKNKKLIEGNGYDAIYGAGIWTTQITENNYGPGKNIQGNLLMKVRNDLSNHRSLTMNEKSRNSKSHHFSSEQVKAANTANLLDFIQDSGVQLRRVGHDSYKGVEHDSLVITPSKNSFYWNSRSTGGVGALDFATKYLLADSNLEEGEKFQKGMELVLKSSAGQFIPHKEDLQPFAFNKNQLSKQFNQAYAYLTKTRKINPKLVKQLHEAGLIEQNQYGNALFLWRDPTTRKIKGASIQGTKINHEKYGKRGTLKKIEPNSTKGYGFSFSVGKPENLYFFEAPIDAMSYYCLHPKLHNSQFIAMDGLKKTVFANYFKLADNQLSQIQSGVKTINFGVDNDAAGTQFMETFQEDDGTYKHLVNSQGEMVPINRVSPSSTEGKDWNEVLQRKSKSSYHSKTLSFKKKQFELTPAYATNHAVTQMEHLLDDYNLTSQNSKVYVSNNKINTIYSNPHAPEILGLIQLDTQDLLNATTIIAKDRANQYKAINKHIDQQELLDKTINYVVAKNLTTGLYKPKIGATRANLSMNQKEIREQVINSRSYFMKKAKEVEQFEQSPVFSKIHHILKKQDKLLNRSTSSLNIKNEKNRYLLTGCLKKGNAKKSFAININPTVLAENDDKISQLFNQKLSNHKSIKNSFKRSYINQQNIVNREM